VLDVSQLDRKLLVSNAEAAAAVRVLLEREGIFAGVSAGAVVDVARRVADELPDGAVVVCVLADGGWKYLSAPFWQGEEIDEAVLWW
jgi:cysteine synthase